MRIALLVYSVVQVRIFFICAHCEKNITHDNTTTEKGYYRERVLQRKGTTEKGYYRERVLQRKGTTEKGYYRERVLT
jgi:hypothetical protein